MLLFGLQLDAARLQDCCLIKKHKCKREINKAATMKISVMQRCSFMFHSVSILWRETKTDTNISRAFWVGLYWKGKAYASGLHVFGTCAFSFVHFRACLAMIILGAFTEFWKVALSFVMSVRPSACNNSAPSGRILIKLDISAFFKNMSREFKLLPIKGPPNNHRI